MDEDWDNRVLLLKYQPKFYRKVQFSPSDLQEKKLLTKLQRIKVIQSLENLSPKNTNLPSILSAFKSQRHQVKKLALSHPNVFSHFPKVSNYTFSLKDLKSWKVFLKQIHIEKLGIIRPSNDSILTARRNIQSFQLRFWSHFEKLRNLKSLDIRLYQKFDKELYDFFVRLNSHKIILESLGHFSLFLNYLDAPSHEDLGFVNIYKNLTSLRIHELSYSSLGKFLRNLENCGRLSYLNLLKTFKHAQEAEGSVNLNFLRSLSCLSELKNIDLAFNLNSCLLLSHFLDCFSLPKEIISLKISLYETDWKPIDQLDTSKSPQRFFESQDSFKKFYEKWNDLEHLESLSLCFYETGSLNTPTLYFVTPILAKLTRLVSFYYANWCNSLSEKIKALDFPYLWQSLKHLKGTIKKISVESFAISLRKFSRNLIEDGFQLQELSLCGFVFGDTNLRNCLNLFPNKRLLAVENQTSEPSLALDIEHLVIDDHNSLAEVLNLLRNASHKLHTFLNLDVRKLKGSEFVNIACRLIPLIPHKSPINLKFSQIPLLDPQEQQRFKLMLSEYNKSRKTANTNNPETDDNEEEEKYEDSVEEIEENIIEEEMEEEEDIEEFRNYEDDVSSEMLGDSMDDFGDDRFNDIDESL